MNIKQTLLTFASALGALAFVTTATYAIGTLTPGDTPGENTQYTLNDIYTKLTTGADATPDSGLFTTPEIPAASFNSLTEIYNALPDWQTLSDTTTTVTEGFYEATDLVTADGDLIATNIVSGVNIFGVVGTVIEGTPELEWSTLQPTSADWPTAVSICAGTVDGSTGWRLPSLSELLSAISDDFIVNGVANPRFVTSIYYWSGNQHTDTTFAWRAYWNGLVVSAVNLKTTVSRVYCVR